MLIDEKSARAEPLLEWLERHVASRGEMVELRVDVFPPLVKVLINQHSL
jgi:hypothetical protein